MIVELTHVHIYSVHIMKRDKHSIILHGIRAFHIFYSHNEKRQTPTLLKHKTYTTQRYLSVKSTPY
jgi:hypothetical protein